MRGPEKLMVMRRFAEYIAFSLLLVSCSGNVPIAIIHKTAEQTPVKVRTKAVIRESITSGTTYVGRVEPSKSAYILAQVPGPVERINVSRGRRVEKGAVIATIGSEAVKSSHEIAKATLEQAEDGYERVQKVYASGSVPEVKMVEIRTQLQKARSAEKAAAQALENCNVTAPFSGIVEEVCCEPGEQIALAQPVVRILDVANIEVHFNVPEGEYSSIPLGSKVEIEIPALKKTTCGTVAVKGVSASALSHSYDFTAKGISDAVGMMPGMVCKLRINSSNEGVIVVPASCVMTDSEGRFVWTVDGEGIVGRTHITTGGYSGTGVVVSGGLEEGTKVVVEGARRISTGMKVEEI